MNELDYILLFVILVGVVVGLRRGILRILISIVGIYFTVLIAGYFYHPMGETLASGWGRILSESPHLSSTRMHNLSYLILVIATTVVIEVISHSTFEETQIPLLGRLDNLLGGGVGIVYGALWAMLLLVPIQYGIARTGGVLTDAVFESQLAPVLNDLFQTAVLDILSFFFLGGVPQLYLNSVSRKVSYFFPELVFFTQHKG